MTERERKIGMTYSQLLATITILGAMLAGWVAINVRMAEMDTRIDALEESKRENRQEHQTIIEKLEKLIFNINKMQ